MFDNLFFIQRYERNKRMRKESYSSSDSSDDDINPAPPKLPRLYNDSNSDKPKDSNEDEEYDENPLIIDENPPKDEKPQTNQDEKSQPHQDEKPKPHRDEIPHPHQDEIPQPHEYKTPQHPRRIANNPDLIVNGFKAHVPHWGGFIHYKGKRVRIVNTCTQDNLQFAIWVLAKLKPDFVASLPQIPKTIHLTEFIDFIDTLQWNKAKEKFIVDIMQNGQQIKDGRLNFFGSEHNQFLRFMADFQNHRLRQLCSESCNLNGAFLENNSNSFNLNKINERIVLDSLWTGRCPKCSKEFDVEVIFDLNVPQFIFFTTRFTNIFYSDLPKELVIDGKRFKLLCATILDNINYQIPHFVSIFELNGNNFVVNGIGSQSEYLPPFNPEFLTKRKVENNIKYYKSHISTAMYYLI